MMTQGPGQPPHDPSGQWPEPNSAPASQKNPTPVRWGVRTLILLSIAALAILLSILQGRYTLLSLALLLFGFGGALYCSVRGLTTPR